MAGRHLLPVAALAGATALLGACTTITSTNVCDPDNDPDVRGGWCSPTRDVAERSWLYAQMATNAYEPSEDDFILPGRVIERVRQSNDARGYAYNIYDRFDEDRLVETVIAFRGTEFTHFNDWLFGNILGAQNPRGLATVRDVAAQLDTPEYSEVEITVTGHSLGGGIAQYVSLRPIDDDDGTVNRSVVFNNSPRFSGHPRELERLAVAERGEVLTLFRLPAREADQTYQSINCQPGFSPLRDHSMRALAECLTWIAAYDEADARFAMLENPRIERPATRRSEEMPEPVAGMGNGIPVNPYIAGHELARAVQTRLTASPTFQPLYANTAERPALHRDYAGLSLIVAPARAGGTHTVIWKRNQAELLVNELDCSALTVADCAERIVAAGEALLE